MKPIRVLIVDDSRTMRALLNQALSEADDIEVVGVAEDAASAREAIKGLNPDVVTLDVEMPGMNGLDFLDRLMRLRPMPVVMVSSHTTAKADLTLQALALGALDCIPKPTSGAGVSFPGLIDSVRAASNVRFTNPSQSAKVTPTVTKPKIDYVSENRLIAIGSSAGGIEALSIVLADYPADGPPVVITQHMPAEFTKALALRLDGLCHAKVTEARDGDVLEIGTVHVAPGGARHLEIVKGTKWHCRLREGDLVSGHRPSVDVLFASVAQAVGNKAVGVILSGMGRDGAVGLRTMRDIGAPTFGQDEATSFIYGMPRVAFEAGAVERQLPVNRIQQAMLAATNLKKATTPCH